MKCLEKGSKFKICEVHLKLAQRMYVSWDGCEYGAPSIDCKLPYGNSNVTKDILEIAGLPYNQEEEVPEHLEDYARQIHEDMGIVLQICLYLKKFETGIFELQDSYDARSWKKV